MNSPGPSDPCHDDTDSQLAELLAAYDEAQRAGGVPQDDRLAALPAAARAELRRAQALLQVLGQARPASSATWNPDPPAPPGQEQLFALVSDEIRLRAALGQSPDLDEYCRRYPQLADVLRARFAGPHRDDTPPSRERTPEPDVPVVPRLAGYTIEAEIGRGGMGIVYRAWQERLRRPVALKMIRPGMLADPGYLARFRREAEAVARLRHPHIVQVYEVGDWQPGDSGPIFPYCAFEYADGGSLDRYLGGNPLPFTEAAALVETLARAVHSAHEAGIIHRDLKPANILLFGRSGRGPGGSSAGPQDHDTSPGEGVDTPRCCLADCDVKITDFGLAKRVASAAGLSLASGATESGVLLGTPSYMAPEQASGKSTTIGPAADVYSLGAILYELLTGRPPFRAATGVETVLLVLTEEPVPITRLQPKVPRDLETIALTCLQKPPEHRYRSALELAEDLRRFQDREPIRARPASTPERVVKWARRRPAVAGLLTLVLLLLLTGVPLVTWKWYDADQQRRQAQRLAVELAQDAGQAHFEAGDAARGLLWLARSLEHAAQLDTPEAAALQRSLGWSWSAWRTRLHTLEAILPQDTSVYCLALQPHGRLFASGDLAGRVRLWNLATLRPHGPPLLHTKQVRTVAFSPDGRTLASGSADGTARLWNVTVGKPLGEPLQHGDEVTGVAFRPDGRVLVTSSTDGTIRFWDAATGSPGQVVRTPAKVWAVAFSPDGTKVLVGNHDRKARLYDAVSGALAGPELEHANVPVENSVRSVAFSPDGRTALTASLIGVAQMWDVATGKPVGYPMRHQGSVRTAIFSPDGTTVLTGGGDRTAHLWATATCRSLGHPLPHEGSVRALAFGPDGRTLLTASVDQTIRVWKLAAPPARVLTHTNSVKAAVFSPDGRQLASAGKDGTVWFWRTDTGTALPHALAQPHRHEVVAIARSPDGRTVLSGSLDGTARLWDAATGQPVGPPLEHEAPVLYVAFVQVGGTAGRPAAWAAVTAGLDGKARLWDAATAAPLGPPLEHGAATRGLAVSPDGTRIATVGADGTVRLWDAATGQDLGVQVRHGRLIRAYVFSPDGSRLLTGGEDSMARLWDLATGQLLVTLPMKGAVRVAAFRPDGRFVVVGDGDSVAQVWETATGQPVGSPLVHDRELAAVAFSPDGRLVLTASRDATAQLWEAATGQAVGPRLRHAQTIHTADFSPDGRTVVTTSGDGTACLWPVPAPLDASVERVVLWTQTATGLEIENKVIRVLDADRRQARRERLQDLGGPP